MSRFVSYHALHCIDTTAGIGRGSICKGEFVAGNDKAETFAFDFFSGCRFIFRIEIRRLRRNAFLCDRYRNDVFIEEFLRLFVFCVRITQREGCFIDVKLIGTEIQPGNFLIFGSVSAYTVESDSSPCSVEIVTADIECAGFTLFVFNQVVDVDSEIISSFLFEFEFVDDSLSFIVKSSTPFVETTVKFIYLCKRLRPLY